MRGGSRTLVGGLLHMPSGTPTGTRDASRSSARRPAFGEGVEIFFDPFPSLIVQDEMHLLEESLGTFGGIFETGLFAWLSRCRGSLASGCVGFRVLLIAQAAARHWCDCDRGGCR